MELQKEPKKLGGAYARKESYEWEGKKFEADIKNGDMVKILSGGTKVEGQFGEQFVIQIETKNGVKNFTLNPTTKDILIDEFGTETKQWIGKNPIVLTKKDTINGKKVVIAYLTTKDYQIDEYGEVVKKRDDVETIEYPEDETEDIPF